MQPKAPEEKAKFFKHLFLINRGLDSIAMVDSSNNTKHRGNVVKKPLIARKPRSKKVGRPKNISAKAKKNQIIRH